MVDFVSKNNFFEFNSKFFQQISRTAIGIQRFIDGAFFIWTDSEENLERFLKELNGFHSNIKFTFKKSKTNVNFFDVVIKIKNGRLSTDLYSKPVGSYQYLHYTSYHADHIKKIYHLQ